MVYIVDGMHGPRPRSMPVRDIEPLSLPPELVQALLASEGGPARVCMPQGVVCITDGSVGIPRLRLVHPPDIDPDALAILDEVDRSEWSEAPRGGASDALWALVDTLRDGISRISLAAGCHSAGEFPLSLAGGGATMTPPAVISPARPTPSAPAPLVTIDEAVSRWRDEMTSRDLAPKSIDRFLGIIGRVQKWAGWTTTASIRVEDVEAWMAAGRRGELPRPGREPVRWGGATYNQAVTTHRLFGAFLLRKGLTTSNPFDGLLTARKPDARRRRALSETEARRLIAGTLARQTRDKRAQGSPALVYATALMTGLRYAELRSMTWGAVSLGAEPCIRTDPRWEGNKARRRDYIALPFWVASLLRLHRSSVAHRTTDPVFPVCPNRQTWRMDLDAAGIPEVDDRGRVTNFHCCRATYATMLDGLGLTAGLTAAMTRHATTLTEARYIDTHEQEMFAAAQKLPNLWPHNDLPPYEPTPDDPDPPDSDDISLALGADTRYLGVAKSVSLHEHSTHQPESCGGPAGGDPDFAERVLSAGLPPRSGDFWEAGSGAVTPPSRTVTPITALEDRAIALIIGWMESRQSRPPKGRSADGRTETGSERGRGG